MPPHEEITRARAHDIPDERLVDLQLTAYMANRSERISMYSATDIVEWMEDYWRDRDPTPGTPENEILQAYRQRTEYLVRRFPDTSFGGWPLNWITFLQHGLPDARIAYNHSPRTVYGSSGSVTYAVPSSSGRINRLRYESPKHFILVLREESDSTQDLINNAPGGLPSLKGVWEDLEDPGTSVQGRQRALLSLSWYELPEVASRLLNLPEELFAGLAEQRDEAFLRLAVRSSYLLEPRETRRLAALRAAGAAPRLILRRVISGRYTAADLRLDLDALKPITESKYALERIPDRGPHMDLWEQPEVLLEDIASRFHSDERVTEWDWRGDLYLAYGPPAWLSQDNRHAVFTWGTPETIKVEESMLGWVRSTRTEDILTDFIDISEKDIRTRKRKGVEATEIVASALRGSQDSRRRRGTELALVLEQLHVLSPPPVFQIGMPEGGRHLPLTMDAVAFPSGEDSIEVQVTFGIPTEAVRIREVELGYTTDLRTSLVVMDHNLHIVYAAVRSIGYLIEGRPEIEDMLLLDTFQFETIPGAYIAFLSVEDPRQGISGGALQNLDFNWRLSRGLQVSPLMLASELEINEGTGKFNRGGFHILPAPSRFLRYGYEFYIYFEISNLSRSEFGDYAWEEAYFVVPDSPADGIVKVSIDQELTRLTPHAYRSMGIDLSNLDSTSERALFLIVLITDKVSGEQAVGVTRLNLLRPD